MRAMFGAPTTALASCGAWSQRPRVQAPLHAPRASGGACRDLERWLLLSSAAPTPKRAAQLLAFLLPPLVSSAVSQSHVQGAGVDLCVWRGSVCAIWAAWRLVMYTPAQALPRPHSILSPGYSLGRTQHGRSRICRTWRWVWWVLMRMSNLPHKIRGRHPLPMHASALTSSGWLTPVCA